MLTIFFWLAFGAVIGWVAAILQGEEAIRRVTAFVVIGAIGGLVGGIGGALLDAPYTTYHAATADIMFAVFGSVLFVFLAGFTAHKSRSSE